eukprot:Ihof_evm13s20 gene=Ihof_evmTU13s20
MTVDLETFMGEDMSTAKRVKKQALDRRLIAEVEVIRKKNRPITEDELADMIFARREGGALRNLYTFEFFIDSPKYELSPEAKALWDVEWAVNSASKQYEDTLVETEDGPVSGLMAWRLELLKEEAELSEVHVKMLVSLLLSGGKINPMGKNSLEYLCRRYPVSEAGRKLINVVLEKHYNDAEEEVPVPSQETPSKTSMTMDTTTTTL